MKVIHLCLGKANPERMNGVNKVVHALASEQIKQGLDVEVWGITPSPNDKTPSRFYPLKLFQGTGRQFKIPTGIEAAIAQLPPDTIFHIHGVLISVFYSIARFLKKRDIQWVIAPHGAYNKQSLKIRAWLKWPFIILFDRFLIRDAKAIHISTMSEILFLRWLCRKTSVALIKNGQDLDELVFEQKNIPTPTRPIFGFVGRLSYRHKGLDLLIDGFASYIHQGGQGVLWLIGDGPDRIFLEKRIKDHNIIDRVVFYGARFGDDKFNLINAMDIFVHTSRWEVMPIAILEAAGLSVPVLLSKATNFTDYISKWDAGFMLEKNTPQMITQTMLYIDQNLDDLPAKGKNVRNMIAQDFSWHGIACDLMEKAYKG